MTEATDTAPVAPKAPKSDLLSKFKAARRVSTPLISIQTQDPAAAMKLIETGLTKQGMQQEEGKEAKLVSVAPPILVWDCVRGLQWVNDDGLKACWYSITENDANAPVPDTEQEKAAFSLRLTKNTISPVSALQVITRAPSRTIVFFSNAHRQVTPSNPQVSQAIWNLRDIFKMNQRTLVLLCPSITLPSELQQDVFSLDDPLPDRAHLSAIVKRTYKNGRQQPPEDAMVEKAVDALSGLAAYPADQAAAMSLKSYGLYLDELWERKRQMIESAPGLTVNRSTETFADIGGVENAKKFFGSVISGKEPPRGLVFLDEIEKTFGGHGDTSGISQGFLATILSYMQDTRANGSILIGPPGAAKSMLAKAIGNTAGVPTIIFDLNGMKAKLVGDSEANLRNALKIVTAVTQGRALFIATCNSIGSLPPELRRRFPFGTFFFDLPTAEEREVIWQIYLKKYNIPLDTPRPKDSGYTGAEISQCCFLSYNLGYSLIEASSYIVPVAESARDQIKQLREEASGRFISASKPGLYRYEREVARDLTVAGSRAIEMDD